MEEINCGIETYETTTDVETFLKDCVDVEYFLGLCRQCPNYQKIWSCPEYDFDVLGYWKKYRYFRIIGTKIILPKELREKSWTEEETMELYEKTLLKEKRKMTEMFFKLERENPGSVHLSAGSCQLCSPEPCGKADGRPCRHPDRLRYSIESLGGNVTKAAEMLGQKIEWAVPGKMPPYFMLVGGLLYN